MVETMKTWPFHMQMSQATAQSHLQQLILLSCTWVATVASISHQALQVDNSVGVGNLIGAHSVTAALDTELLR